MVARPQIPWLCCNSESQGLSLQMKLIYLFCRKTSAHSKTILPSCQSSLFSLALSSPKGNKLFSNKVVFVLTRSSPWKRRRFFLSRSKSRLTPSLSTSPANIFLNMPWPSEVPQRALKDPSKVPHRALKDLFKHAMVSEGYLQWWTWSSPARSPGPSSWSWPSRPCPQSSSSCRSSSQLGRHFLRCS